MDGGGAILRSRLLQLMGAGKSKSVPRENREFGEAATIEVSTAYGDSFTRHRLEVEWTGMHRDDPLADDFDLLWQDPPPREPVIGGYCPGEGGYSVYPDERGPIFRCANLVHSGRTVVRFQAAIPEVVAALGQPAAVSDDKHWRGFWREGVAEGVLVEFEGPYVDWVVGIEVARDWRLLARRLAERNAKTKALNAR